MISKYHFGARWRLRVVKSVMEIKPDDIVLDVGCADGFICTELAKLAANVVGIDLDEKIITDNKKKTSKEI